MINNNESCPEYFSIYKINSQFATPTCGSCTKMEYCELDLVKSKRKPRPQIHNINNLTIKKSK